MRGGEGEGTGERGGAGEAGGDGDGEDGGDEKVGRVRLCGLRMGLRIVVCIEREDGRGWDVGSR